MTLPGKGWSMRRGQEESMEGLHEGLYGLHGEKIAEKLDWQESQREEEIPRQIPEIKCK